MVRRGPRAELAASAALGNGSALRDFLNQTTVYEKAGGVIPRELVQFGVLGSALLLVAAFFPLVFPNEASIRHGGFFLFFGRTEAHLAALLGRTAVPAMLCGLALLGLDVYLMRAPTSERWRWVVVGQAAAGAIGGVLSVLLLALVILNLAIWVIIIALGVAAACLALAVLAADG